MSAIITNYEIVMKDGSNPSTSTAAANLNADRYSEIMPVTRAFMGEIHVIFDAGPVGVMKLQVSNDEGALDDEGVARINSNNIVTNWLNVSTSTIGSTDDHARFTMADIGYRWVRLFWDSTSGTGNITSARASFKGY
tara:strand:- start:44 stop:454 length:411 start_codon:yes stop_codon:yes gene_type:complete